MFSTYLKVKIFGTGEDHKLDQSIEDSCCEYDILEPFSNGHNMLLINKIHTSKSTTIYILKIQIIVLLSIMGNIKFFLSLHLTHIFIPSLRFEFELVIIALSFQLKA